MKSNGKANSEPQTCSQQSIADRQAGAFYLLALIEE
jgi:hypothetical protein